MSYDQLARIFPDGKSVHIAADGRTLPGYEEARVDSPPATAHTRRRSRK